MSIFLCNINMAFLCQLFKSLQSSWERQNTTEWFREVKVLVTQLCPTLCDPMDYSSPGSSVHRILQERILECPFSEHLQRTFLTQRSNPGLPHCSQTLHWPSHQLKVWDPIYSQFKQYYISGVSKLVSVLWLSGYFSYKYLAARIALPVENREGRADKQVFALK